MYSPFLWRNAKGESKSIIKRRWRWRTPKPCQICLQTMNLIKNVHQNLSLSRLNGQDMIQRTSNVWIIWSSQWRNVSNSSTRSISSSNTCKRGRSPMAELLWTSFKERRNKWGKLIDAPDMKAYKNTHHSRWMVWRWEIGHKEWHATLRNK